MAITIYPCNGGVPSCPTLSGRLFIDEFGMDDAAVSHLPTAL